MQGSCHTLIKLNNLRGDYFFMCIDYVKLLLYKQLYNYIVSVKICQDM